MIGDRLVFREKKIWEIIHVDGQSAVAAIVFPALEERIKFVRSNSFTKKLYILKMLYRMVCIVLYVFSMSPSLYTHYRRGRILKRPFSRTSDK